MTQAEVKRQTGYLDLMLTQYCGNCRNCVRKGTHLRCGRFGFSVSAFGICRAGYEAHDLPLTEQEHPLLVQNEEGAEKPDGKARRKGYS